MAIYLNYLDDVSKLCCFRYFSIWVVITLLKLRCMRTICEHVVTCDWLCWIMYDLGLYVGCLRSFVILFDYRVYMGSSMTVWSLRWLLLYLCSYKLGGSVTASIRARFNIKLVICVFKTKVLFYKNLKCASGHLLYAQLRTIRWLFKY